MMGARIGFGENDTSRYLRVDSGLSRTTVFALTNFRDMFEFLRMQHVMLALQQPQIQSQRAPPHAIQISQIPILGGETKHETRLFQTFQYQYSQCIIWVLKYIMNLHHSTTLQQTKILLCGENSIAFTHEAYFKHCVSMVQIIHCEKFSTSTQRIVCRQNVRNPGAKCLLTMIMMTNHQKLKGICCLQKNTHLEQFLLVHPVRNVIAFFCLVGIYTHHHVCKTWAACKFGSVRCSSTKKYFQMLNGNKDNKSETREET